MSQQSPQSPLITETLQETSLGDIIYIPDLQTIGHIESHQVYDGLEISILVVKDAGTTDYVHIQQGVSLEVCRLASTYSHREFLEYIDWAQRNRPEYFI